MTPKRRARTTIVPVQAAIATARLNRQRMQAERQTLQVESQRQQTEAAQKVHVERMEQYLASGDPILVREALDWRRRYPEGWGLPI